MPIVLKHGQFFGRVVAAAQWEPFRISETRYGRGTMLPQHRHEETHLTFVLSGGYRERLKSLTRICAEHAVVLHPAGDTHEDDFAEQPTRCLNVVLPASFAARLGDAAAPLHRGAVVEGAEVAHIGARLSAELRRADAAAQLIIEGLLLELFGTISRTSTDDAPAWLIEARTMIDRGFMAKWSLVDIAGAVGVHPVHLARSFRSRFGVSVGEHVRARRIAWAREQIVAGRALSAIATEAGFTDQSHFSKAFRQALGVPPSEYRRRLAASR
jgi:AraC family transcriptional regulator